MLFRIYWLSQYVKNAYFSSLIGLDESLITVWTLYFAFWRRHPYFSSLIGLYDIQQFQMCWDQRLTDDYSNMFLLSAEESIWTGLCVCASVCASVRAKECVTRHRIFSSCFTQTAHRKTKTGKIWHLEIFRDVSTLRLSTFSTSKFLSSISINDLQGSSMIIQYYCTGIITDQSWIINNNDFRL